MRRAAVLGRVVTATAVALAAVGGGWPGAGAEDPAPTPTTAAPTETTVAPPTTGPPTTASPPTTAPVAPVPTVTVDAGSGLVSPNGDGRSDRRPLTVTVDTAVELDLQVVSLRTGTTAVLADDAPVGPGAHRYVWNGRLRRTDGTTGRARDGRYRVEATARVTPDGEPVTATTEVVVDTRPPTVSLLRLGPEPWSGSGPLTVRFAAGDPHGPVTSWATIGRYGRTVAATSPRARPDGGTTLRWQPRQHRRLLVPGGYEVRVVARDAAGNTRRSAVRPVRVHRRVGNQILTDVPRAGRRVAITIDDCYDPGAWASMLTTLDRMNAGATFFCNGQYVRRFADLARRTARTPRISLGAHSTDHAELPTVGYSGTLLRLLGDEAAWWAVARTSPAPWFRPPYGAHDSAVRAAAGDASFTHTVLWDVDTRDWETSDPGTIVARARDQAKPGSIILLHTKPQSARALPAIIAGLRARGLQPVGLHELLPNG